MPAPFKQFNGRLNTDDDGLTALPTDHLDARNIVFRGTFPNLQVRNIRGTTLIPNELLPNTGTNQAIGGVYDPIKQKVYTFNWNSDDKHGIYQYDIRTRIFSKLLICFTDSQTDILQFDLNFPIASVNILYTSEDVGDILHWVARNNRPMKLNVQDALDELYGDDWLEEYLTVARTVPLTAPSCSYKDDATITINNLRKKLYQFRYRYVYKDLTKSTWSAWSKLFAPANPDDVANNIDETKNNRIDVTVQTGGEDAIAIEIAARQTLAATYSDPFLVTTLNKETLGLSSNTAYLFQFLNDSSYPYIDLEESLQLFDYVPYRANCQDFLNGNVIIYGGVTEGYNLDEILDVELAVELIPFSDTASLSFTFIQQDVYTQGYWEGTANTGDVITFTADQRGNIGMPDEIVTVTVLTYTATGGESAEDIRDYFVNAYNTALGSTGIIAISIGGNAGWETQFIYPFPNSSSAAVSIDYASSSANPVDGVANSIYKHRSRYQYGIVYFDKYGVTNGVVTEIGLKFETPEIDTSGDEEPDIPQITLTISHQPPIWAYSFSIVRTSNLSVSFLLSTVSCDTDKDSGGTPKYAYINIKNQQDNQSGYSAYESYIYL